MTLTGAEVEAIFDPVVKEVLNLVTSQIKAAKRHVKDVVLVGGFGQSAYLRDAIREEVRSSGVEVLQSPNRSVLTLKQEHVCAKIPQLDCGSPRRPSQGTCIHISCVCERQDQWTVGSETPWHQ